MANVVMPQLGETVMTGKECFRLVDADPLLARVYFPERELPRLKVGQTALVSVDAHPGKEFPARITLVNPVVDRTNGTFKVTLEVRSQEGLLRPGSFARVRIRTGTFDDYTVAMLAALNIASDFERYRRTVDAELADLDREVASVELLLEAAMPEDAADEPG